MGFALAQSRRLGLPALDGVAKHNDTAGMVPLGFFMGFSKTMNTK